MAELTENAKTCGESEPFSSEAITKWILEEYLPAKKKRRKGRRAFRRRKKQLKSMPRHVAGNRYTP